MLAIFGKSVAWIIVLCGLAWASWLSIRSSEANLLYLANTPESLSRAVILDPGNAAYHALLAEHMESGGHSPQAQLAKSIELSPLDSSFMVRSALRAEQDRDYKKAESLLNQAAAIDHKFLPRWALLNYYFRRQAAAGFWVWFSRSLEMSADEYTSAIFRLGWEESQNPDLIFRHLPETKQILERYLDFLVSSIRLAPADPVARRLALVADNSDLSLLMTYCELAAPAETSSAVAVWNTLCHRKILRFAPLDPAGGHIVTNSAFVPAAAPRGFDWRIPQVDGVFVTQADAGNGVSIHLDGSEPQDCVILTQTMPVTANRNYQIHYEFSSSEPMLPGLHWEVRSSDHILNSSPELAATTDWKPGQVSFDATGPLVELLLRYHRPLGSVRAEGMVTIRNLHDLEPGVVRN